MHVINLERVCGYMHFRFLFNKFETKEIKLDYSIYLSIYLPIPTYICETYTALNAGCRQKKPAKSVSIAQTETII